MVPLASLQNVRVGAVRYTAGQPRIAVVEWTADLTFTSTYRRWFAHVASGADVRLDALRYHVHHELGVRQSSFIYRDGFWFYRADRFTTATPATVVWDRQAMALRRLTVGSCVLLFAVSLGCIVLNTYLRRTAMTIRRKLNPGFERLFLIGAACVLTSGISGYWRTHVDVRSDEPIFFDVPGLPSVCALSWGDLLPPCDYTIAKALGFRGSDQAIYINIDYFWAPPLLSKSPAQPIQCVSSRVDHVGNGMTAFVLSNRHLYYTYAIFEEPHGEEASLIRKIRTDSIVSSCLDADERQFLKTGDGFVKVRQLWH